MFKYSANVLRVIRHFDKFLLTQQWIVTCLKIYQLIFLDVKNRHRQDRNLNTDQTRCFLPNRRRSRERGCQTSGPVAGTSLEWQPLTFTGPEVSPRPADTSTQAQVRHTLHVCVCVCVFVESAPPIRQTAALTTMSHRQGAGARWQSGFGQAASCRHTKAKSGNREWLRWCSRADVVILRVAVGQWRK